MITRIALMVWMAHASAHRVETRQKLAVCLSVEAADRHLISAIAKGLATRMFADIGIRLEWKSCERAGESSQRPIPIKLVSGPLEGFKSNVLGYAAPYQGRHIVIFFDRIEPMPRPGALLAHVMVHEITHVVQGVSRHSQSGMMKAHWSSRDLLQMQYKPLPFAREDVDLLYRGLAARRELKGTSLAAQ
jgi:hypothetical protein